MSGRLSRNKGKRFEQLIARLLRPFWGTWRGARQSRRGDDAADVENSPFWIECSHGAAPSIPGKWRQATRATDGRPVLVVTRRNRGPILVTMEIQQFQRLLALGNDEEE